jgi:hypothetical protein
VVEFQTRWDNLMDELRYRENFWFKYIYNMRERWVLAHMNDKFWAGMTTTQCVESLNTFLKKYLRQKATLGEFVIRFQEALKRIWEGEHEAEHDYKYKILRLNSALNIKRSFRDVYTNNIFYRCQDEFQKVVNLTSRFLLERD